MMHLRSRVLGLILAVLGAAVLSAQRPAVPDRPASKTSASTTSKGPRVEISFSQSARAEPVTGMVYLAISKDNKSAPIQQTDPEGVPLFSKYVEQLKPGATIAIGPEDRGHPVASLKDI